MKKSFSIIGFFVSLLAFAVITLSISTAFALPALAVGGSLFALSFIPKPQGALFMALDVELWKNWIVDELFKDNSFLNFCRNADDYVLQGSVVHIPQAGAASSVSRNRSSLPATIKKRTDTDVTYALDEFTSDPRLLTNAETILSYDKMNSMMGQDMNAIKQLVAEWMLYHWRPEGSANLLRTTGTTSVTAHVDAATGNRKKLILADIRAAKFTMNKLNLPRDKRYCIIDETMLDQLVSALSVTDSRDFSAAYDAKEGVIGRLEGFNFISRSTVLRASSALAVKDPDAAGATTDHAVVLCYQADYVERALGTTNIFEKKQDPQYYGDIYSLLVRAGGRKVHTSGTGVVGVIQDTAS